MLIAFVFSFAFCSISDFAFVFSSSSFSASVFSRTTSFASILSTIPFSNVIKQSPSFSTVTFVLSSKLFTFFTFSIIFSLSFCSNCTKLSTTTNFVGFFISFFVTKNEGVKLLLFLSLVS